MVSDTHAIRSLRDGLVERDEPLLQRDAKGVLEAKWVLAELCARHPTQFIAGQARTPQRRFRDWPHLLFAFV